MFQHICRVSACGRKETSAIKFSTQVIFILCDSSVKSSEIRKTNMWSSRILAGVLLLCFLSIVVGQQTPLRLRVIDLTYPFNSRTPYWKFYNSFRLTTTLDNPIKPGVRVQAEVYQASTHGGTHMDAAAHFLEGGQTIDQIPVSNFIAPGVAIDISDKVAADPDYRFHLRDVLEFESSHGRLPYNSIVLVYTGYGHFADNVTEFFGLENGDWSKPHFPGLHPSAATFFVRDRKILAVGIDSPSIDYAQTVENDCHQILLREGLYLIEGAYNLHSLPPTGFKVIALPMKISKAGGAPTRVIAILN